jgi:hypothetical protein
MRPEKANIQVRKDDRILGTLEALSGSQLLVAAKHRSPVPNVTSSAGAVAAAVE